MARTRITWISPTGAGHTSALVAAVLAIVVSIAFALFLLVFGFLGRPGGDTRQALTTILFFPVVYYAVGWIMGYLAASAFNLISRLTKGLEVEFAEDRQVSEGEAPDAPQP